MSSIYKKNRRMVRRFFCMNSNYYHYPYCGIQRIAAVITPATKCFCN